MCCSLFLPHSKCGAVFLEPGAISAPKGHLEMPACSFDCHSSALGGMHWHPVGSSWGWRYIPCNAQDCPLPPVKNCLLCWGSLVLILRYPSLALGLGDFLLMLIARCHLGICISEKHVSKFIRGGETAQALCVGSPLAHTGHVRKPRLLVWEGRGGRKDHNRFLAWSSFED